MARSPKRDGSVAGRFKLALDLYATGEAVMRHRIRRQHPDLDDAEVEARLVAWLQTRPGAEHGDAAGRPVAWPRTPTS
jgi:hypothetical protein